MNLEEVKEFRNADRFPAVSLGDEIMDWLIAEVERLSDELNTEKFRTCERCVEKTAARCVEIVNEKATYNDQCDRTIEAIRKEFEL